MKLASRFASLLTLAALLLMAGGARCQPVTARMRAEDPRLSKTVTLTLERGYLGELLENVSAQTGVVVDADERDTGSGTLVCARLESVPLGQVMDAVWALTGDRDAQWQWVRGGEPGAYRYTLYQTPAARERAARFRRYAQEVLERSVATLTEIARMPPEERSRNRKRIAEVYGWKDESKADGLLESEGFWYSIRIFDEVIPSSARQKVIQGETKYEVVIRDLPEQVQNLVRSSWKMMDLHNFVDGQEVAVRPPQRLQFYATDSAGSLREVIPSVFIRWEPEGGGGSCFGSVGLEDLVRAEIKKRWQLPGDTATDPALARDVPAGNASPADPLLPLPARLVGMARGARLPLFLALMPGGRPGSNSALEGKPLGALLERMQRLSPNLMSKWRDGGLLLSYPGWFVEEDYATPYGLIKRYLHSKDRLIGLKELALLMSATTEKQAEKLGFDYAAVKGALELRPLLSLYSRFPELLSENGMLLDAPKLAMLQALPRFARYPVIAQGKARAIRLTGQAGNYGISRSLDVKVDARVGEREWVSIGGFVQQANDPRPNN